MSMLLRKELEDQAGMRNGQTKSLTKNKAEGKGGNDERSINDKNQKDREAS